MSTSTQHNDLGLPDEQIAAVRLPLEKASVLPPAAYHDETIFKLERERIFARSWMPVCHVSQIAEPGSYMTRNLVGESVLAMHGRDGVIRVMSNVCRHRNTTLASGSGSCKGNRMSCPYHGWTYGLDGKLLAAPFMDQVDDFERRAVHLPVFRSEVWHGFLFVNFDENATPLMAQIEGLEPAIAPYRFEDMEVVELRRRTMPWNWKISLENFSEAYHQPWVHPDTADHEFPAAMARYADVSGPYGLFNLYQKNLLPVPTFFKPVEGLPEEMLSCVTVFNVYPYLHALTDAATPLWLDFNIKNATEHELVWNVLLPKGTLASPTLQEELDKLWGFFEPILGEDIGVCTGVGEAVSSRFITPGRYSHMEKTIHQFHNWWLDLMLEPAAR
ncbi:aromatic ring-hydroxylating oxygenase subunit alpha [Pseudomonas sp. LRF_L74]|uniref:aromatic ring-hydroxylating oxygenase subunit alpha n=1 Tax=Pseudomonas sp. LRF_L74 TaxID=3369422 RepID=UPI003F5DA4BC